ncbi:putative quinol monooxygenase [uncultured Draconibacterium sp.]|uniref:putative quinol monooxygenase n=1 Tax=uncultured Draconibacterium sp. TaxID=1573823 RepID=UPI0029C8C069|nr:putative quinol monooxygenase [uncultured Draconibacterium sp.]
MITIVAKFIVNKGQESTFLKLVEELGEASRAEDGNIEYVLHKKVDDPSTYCLIEKWKDRAAIDFHNSTPHFSSTVPKIGELAEVTVDLYELV